MLRVSETLGSPGTKSPEITNLSFHWVDGSSVSANCLGVLLQSAASAQPSRLTLRIGSSKTDRKGSGFTLGTDYTGGPLCAVSAMWHYCLFRSDRQGANGSLFPWIAKHHLARLIQELTTAAQLQGKFNTHSLRWELRPL